MVSIPVYPEGERQDWRDFFKEHPGVLYRNSLHIENMTMFQNLITESSTTHKQPGVSVMSYRSTPDGSLKGAGLYTGKGPIKNRDQNGWSDLDHCPRTAGFSTDESTIIRTAALPTAMGERPHMRVQEMGSCS